MAMTCGAVLEFGAGIGANATTWGVMTAGELLIDAAGAVSETETLLLMAAPEKASEDGASCLMLKAAGNGCMAPELF